MQTLLYEKGNPVCGVETVTNKREEESLKHLIWRW